ncbi:MAG TPA: hypothetical protein DIW47_07335 [Bacteroidetes bacterium]|nr:hypothetical protein [Bacteroidota bacterium]
MKQIALILSVVFHPLLLITLGTYFILEFDRIYHVALDTRTLLTYLLIILMGTFVFPANTIFLLQKLLRKDISVYMQEKEDRRLPLLVAAIFVLLTFYMFSYKLGYRAPHLIRGYLLGTSSAIILASIVNVRYKISLHGIGLGGVLGVLFFLQESAYTDLRWIIAGWFLISGIVCWARLYLESHSPGQIYSGFLTGFFMIYLIIRI